MARVRVAGLSGSLRRGSYNTALLHAAKSLAPNGMDVEIADISAIPMYNDDVRQEGYPPPVQDLRRRIAEADAVLLVSPEYNRSVPALLKNSIDWASRGPDQPFNGKPVAIMGAAPGTLGTVFANHHLRQVLTYLNAQMVTGPEVAVPDARNRFDERGELTHEPTRAFVAAHLEKLATLVRQLRSNDIRATPADDFPSR